MSKSLTRASSGGVHEKSAEELAIAAKVAEVLEKMVNVGETDEDDEGCRIGGIEVEAGRMAALHKEANLGGHKYQIQE